MSWLTSWFSPPLRATYAPHDDFWFQKDPRSRASMSGAGVSSPTQAMRLGAVYACVRILADMVGSLPLHVYRQRADGGRERVVDHPVYRLLNLEPNGYQSSIRWRQLAMRHILLQGNFYCLIEQSTRRIRELLPLNPDLMTVVALPGGRRGYTYRAPGGQAPRTFVQEEIFHLMGFSLDGILGASVLEYARESVGRALSEEVYAARFWSSGAGEKGALATDGKLTKEQRTANAEAWNESQAGWANMHKVALLEGGLKWLKIGVNARDAQFLEGREFSVSDIARWFGVPPHMIGDVDRSTSWGSGIEQQHMGFLTTTLQPWLKTWEQDIGIQLLEDETLYANFLLDEMLRADTATRSEAQRKYVDGGILSVNEVRLMENRNPIPGEQYDKPQRAQNIGGGGNPSVTRGQRGAPTERPMPDDEDEDDGEAEAARALEVVRRAAARLVHLEIGAVTKWAQCYASDDLGWREWVARFYGKHAERLQAVLGLDQATARAYGAAHTGALLAQGVGVLAEWDRHTAAALMAAALGEEGISWDALARATS